MFTLAAEASTALVLDAEQQRCIRVRTRRSWSTWTRTAYDVTDQPRLVRLQDELQRAYRGASTDPYATAVLTLCVAAGVYQLLPNRPKRKALYRSAEQLPRSAMVANLCDALYWRPDVAGGG
jgi:hypothetical protein